MTSIKFSWGSLWVAAVPLAAIALTFVNQRYEINVRLPQVIFWIFVATLSFLIGALIYKFLCPHDIKDIETIDDWHSRAHALRKKLADYSANEQEQAAHLVKMAAQKAKDMLAEAPPGVIFSRAATAQIIRQIKIRYRAKVDKSPDFMERLSKLTDENFLELNRANLPARLLCFGFVALALAIGGVLIAQRVIEVYQATFT